MLRHRTMSVAGVWMKTLHKQPPARPVCYLSTPPTPTPAAVPRGFWEITAIATIVFFCEVRMGLCGSSLSHTLFSDLQTGVGWGWGVQVRPLFRKTHE